MTGGTNLRGSQSTASDVTPPGMRGGLVRGQPEGQQLLGLTSMGGALGWSLVASGTGSAGTPRSAEGAAGTVTGRAGPSRLPFRPGNLSAPRRPRLTSHV